MKKKIFASIIGFVLVMGIPALTLAAGLVPTCNVGGAVNSTKTGIGTACDFDALLALINNIINFLLFVIAPPLVGLIICWAGFLLMFSGANEHNRTQAKHIFLNVIFGYIIALAAWVVIKTILTVLGFQGPMFLTNY